MWRLKTPNTEPDICDLWHAKSSYFWSTDTLRLQWPFPLQTGRHCFTLAVEYLNPIRIDHVTLWWAADNRCAWLVNRFVHGRVPSPVKDKSFATYEDVIRLLLMFEILKLTLAKKRCEWGCNKTIISENFCVFTFVKTSGYHLKVFVFKLNQIHVCQTTIVEKHLRGYYVRMNSMSKSKSWQIMVHFARR